MNNHFENITLTVPGKLDVKRFDSRRGSFWVGTLHSAVGTFTVRDEWLRTFEPGEYSGNFDIGEFFLYSYHWYGEQRTAIRVAIESWILDGEDEDWIEEDSDVAFEESEDDDYVAEEHTTEEVESDDVDFRDYVDDNVLLLREFHVSDSGELWCFGDDYQIDSTLEREDIVCCRQALLTLGYQHNVKTRTWYLPDEEGGAL